MENLKLRELLDEFRREINYFRFDEQYIIDVAVRSFNTFLRIEDAVRVVEILIDEFNPDYTLRENVIYAIDHLLTAESHE